MNPASDAHQAISKAGNSRALTTVARIGFAASGLMHLLMGSGLRSWSVTGI